MKTYFTVHWCCTNGKTGLECLRFCRVREIMKLSFESKKQVLKAVNVLVWQRAVSNDFCSECFLITAALPMLQITF